MTDISRILKDVYHAHSVALVPGSGTYGMEAVARQFATGKPVLVIRNGWFSYRWTQIFDMGHIPASSTVLKARQVGPGAQAPWAPAPIAEVQAASRLHAGEHALFERHWGPSGQGRVMARRARVRKAAIGGVQMGPDGARRLSKRRNWRMSRAPVANTATT
jgi:hypothetical protein